MKPNNLLMFFLALLAQAIDYKAQSVLKPDTNSIISLNQKAWKARNNDLELAKKYAIETIHGANLIC